MNRTLQGIVLILVIGWCVGDANAESNPIPAAYRNIAASIGVPSKILYAIALAESKLLIAADDIKPWPWTINVRGKPQRFMTGGETKQALDEALKAGITNIDVGLMQVNMHYHQQRFDSTSDAVQPYRNIRVGALILKEEYQRCHQDWWCAVGHYHSRNKRNAERYTNTVRSLWQQLD